ncbi:hypothetical protein DFH11DRAFT_1558459 [Phellopilus nigrolimitatus]|nr:hypothetical protein DFH11DRAFT_1558459 [Phellopilus nigrolimitatus]
MSKPVLYTFGGSVWSAAPELAIAELGYSSDAIETKVVNLVNGENFAPSFIKINPNATLPTLTANGTTYTNTVDVISYLIKNAPKPVGKPSGTDLVKLIHEDSIDPNFALLLSRSDEEKKARTDGIVLTFLANRQSALEKHSVTPEAASFSDFYKDKIAGNGSLLAIYADNAPAGAKQKFFETSEQHWANIRKFVLEALPGYLPESGFIGGASPGEDDFHLGAWLARIVATIGGKHGSSLANQDALKQAVPPKVLTYWNTWSARDSWKTVYAEGLH